METVKLETYTPQESNYIFPRGIAQAMAKIDQRTQYEATMLSMSMMMIGLILSVVYVCFFIDFRLWFKIVTAINGLFGIVFMLSFLVTTFQQYKSYISFVGFTTNINTSSIPTTNDKEVIIDGEQTS